MPWFSALKLSIADRLLPTLLLYASHIPLVAPILLSLCPQKCCHFLPVPPLVTLAGHLHGPVNAPGLAPATQKGSFPT